MVVVRGMCIGGTLYYRASCRALPKVLRRCSSSPAGSRRRYGGGERGTGRGVVEWGGGWNGGEGRGGWGLGGHYENQSGLS